MASKADQMNIYAGLVSSFIFTLVSIQAACY